MSSLHVNRLLAHARANGLSFPTLAGGVAEMPGQMNYANSAALRYAVDTGKRIRQREQAIVSGRVKGIGGQRFDSASPTFAADAKYGACVAEWVEFFGEANAHGGNQRLDSARFDSLVPMASQALTSFIPEVYQVQHAGLVAWDGSILKVGDGMVDPAAEDYVWYDRDIVASVRAASTYAINDIPMVSGPMGQANRGLVVPFLLGFETNFMDQRRSALARDNRKPDFQIEQAKIEACQTGLAQAANGLWLYGDPILGIQGFHNHPSVATISLAGGPWSGKTAAQINSDLVQILNTIRNSAQGGQFNDLKKIKILLPPLQYQRAQNLIVSASGDKSVLRYFLDNNGLRDDQVQQVYDFQASNSAIWDDGPLGLAADTGAVIYNLGDQWDPMFIMPQKIEMPAPPRQNGLGETTFYHMRIGGMRVADARRMQYIQGL